MADISVSRGVVLSDINNDGYLDVVKRDQGGPAKLYLSRCGDDSWTRIRLASPSSNTFGAGARIQVVAGDRTWARWIEAGSSAFSMQPLEAHFGLGDIDRLVVTWPDGVVSELTDVPVRSRLRVVRSDA